MIYPERNKIYRNGEDSKGVSEPHSDAQRNLRYCLDLLKKIEILESSLYWEIYDFKEQLDPYGKPEKVITEPKYIFFCWEERGEKWTGERSFHKDHETFKKEMVGAINFLLQKRFVKRFGIPIGTKKKPKAIDPDDKYGQLFGRD